MQRSNDLGYVREIRSHEELDNAIVDGRRSCWCIHACVPQCQATSQFISQPVHHSTFLTHLRAAVAQILGLWLVNENIGVNK